MAAHFDFDADIFEFSEKLILSTEHTGWWERFMSSPPPYLITVKKGHWAVRSGEAIFSCKDSYFRKKYKEFSKDLFMSDEDYEAEKLRRAEVRCIYDCEGD